MALSPDQPGRRDHERRLFREERRRVEEASDPDELERGAKPRDEAELDEDAVRDARHRVED